MVKAEQSRSLGPYLVLNTTMSQNSNVNFQWSQNLKWKRQYYKNIAPFPAVRFLPMRILGPSLCVKIISGQSPRMHSDLNCTELSFWVREGRTGSWAPRARVSVCGTGHRLSQELEIPGPCDKHKRDQKLCSVLNGTVCCPMTKRPLALDVSTKLNFVAHSPRVSQILPQIDEFFQVCVWDMWTWSTAGRTQGFL